MNNKKIMKKILLILAILFVPYLIQAQTRDYYIEAIEVLQTDSLLVINDDTFNINNSANGQILQKVSGIWVNADPSYVDSLFKSENALFTNASDDSVSSQLAIKTFVLQSIVDSAAVVGDVTASTNITDNTIVRGDGGAKGVQESLIEISDIGDLLPTISDSMNLGSETYPFQNAYFIDDSNNVHDLRDMKMDNLTLRDDIALTKYTHSEAVVAGVWTYIITDASGTGEMIFNINKTELIHSGSSMSVIITSYAGTDLNPKTIYIYIQNDGADNPELVASNTSPSGVVEAADVAQFKAGTVSASDVTLYGEYSSAISQYEFVHNAYHRFYADGTIYNSGMTTTSIATNVTIGAGSVTTIFDNVTTTSRAVIANGLYYIKNDGTYNDLNDFAFTEYSTGESISNDKFYNVVLGVISDEHTSYIHAIVQAGDVIPSGKEYKNIKDAMEDKYGTIRSTPSDQFLKGLFVPVCRIVIKNDGDDELQEVPESGTGIYSIDLRSGVTGGGGSVPSASNIIDGTAEGQMTFWDATNSEWTYTETSELKFDDVNKTLIIPNSGLILNNSDTAVNADGVYDYVGDTASLLHWADTTTFIATKKNLSDTASALRTDLIAWTDTTATIATKYDLDTTQTLISSNLQDASWGESYITNFRDRALDDGATYYTNQGGYEIGRLKTIDIWKQASLVMLPSAVKEDTLYSVKPFESGKFLVTRADTATRVNADGYLELVMPDVARIDYTDGDAVVLTEPERTNLIEDPITLDDVGGYWTLSGATSSGGFSSPSVDYPTDAFKLVESAVSEQHYIIRTTTGLTSTGTYSLSVYAKADERSWISLIEVVSAEGVYFDLENGTTGTIIGTPNSYSITEIVNGWYRCDINIDIPATTAGFRVRLSDGDDNSNYLGDGTSGLYIRGAQLEEGSYPTSLTYRGVEGSAVTRSADVVNGAGSASTFSGALVSGVLYAEMASMSDDFSNAEQLSISDGSGQNAIVIYYATTNITGYSIIAGTVDLNNTYAPTEVTDFHKIAIRWDASNIDLWVDGVERATVVNTGGSFTANPLDRVNFSNSANSDNFFYGKTKGCIVFNRALSDNELELLTK